MTFQYVRDTEDYGLGLLLSSDRRPHDDAPPDGGYLYDAVAGSGQWVRSSRLPATTVTRMAPASGGTLTRPAQATVTAPSTPTRSTRPWMPATSPAARSVPSTSALASSPSSTRRTQKRWPAGRAPSAPLASSTAAAVHDGSHVAHHHVRCVGPRSSSPVAGTSRASSSSRHAVHVATSSASASARTAAASGPRPLRSTTTSVTSRSSSCSRSTHGGVGGRAGARRRDQLDRRPARERREPALGRPARRRRRRCRGVPTSRGPTLPGRRRSPRPARTDAPWPVPAPGCARSAHRRVAGRARPRLVRRAGRRPLGRRRRGSHTAGANGWRGGCAYPASSRRPGAGPRAARWRRAPGRRGRAPRSGGEGPCRRASRRRSRILRLHEC